VIVDLTGGSEHGYSFASDFVGVEHACHAARQRSIWTFPLVPKDKILRPVAQNDRLYGVILNAREGFFKI